MSSGNSCLFQRKSHFYCPVQFLDLGARERSDELGQLHLAETYQVVAQNPAFMLQTFADVDGDLSREAVSASEYRSANDVGESGVDQNLATNDYKAAVEFRIGVGKISVGKIRARLMNAIDFASSHLLVSLSQSPIGGQGSKRLRVGILKTENVLRLSV